MTTTIKNQPLKWHGGKSYLAKWIHSLAPPSVIDNPRNGYTHRNIAYAGGLGEFWNWLPVEGISEAVNDRKSELSNFWDVLACPPLFEKLQRLLEATPFSDEYWSWSSMHDPELDADDAVVCALHFFCKFRMSRQGLGKDYATPTRRTRRGMNENVSAWLSAVEGLPECHERLKRVEIRNMDALDFIHKYDHAQALFYLDPPYLHETRSSTGEYEHEMTEEDHQKLLFQLSNIEGRFMLSGYHSELYTATALAFGWTCHEKEIDNKASSQKSKPKRIECLWTNY